MVLSPAYRAKLDEAASPPSRRRRFYMLFAPKMHQHVTFGGTSVRGWPD